MFKKVTFIINPIFGINRRPARIVELIHSIWKGHSDSYEIIKTSHRGHGVELAKAASEAGSDLVVAVGGDGTINEVGQGLIGTETVLGVVPAGSGNGFARNMAIPLKQKLAIEALFNPKVRRIDVGKINEHYFFNVAGAGLDAVISHLFDNVKMRGPVPYFVIGVREFFRYDPEVLRIHLPDCDLERAPLLLSFANLPQFGIGATIAPNAKADDGLLDICILNNVKFAKALVSLPKLFTGRIDQLPEMEIYQAPKVTVYRASNQPVHTDGDPRSSVPLLTVEVVPGAVKLAVPT